MAQADQAMRKAAMDDPNEWDAGLDDNHTSRLKAIVKQYGWPAISRVGADASTAAWTLVQHADHDLVFQEHCLALMKVLPAGEVQRSSIALLEDRILVGKREPQLYGTQFVINDGPIRPFPIQDEDTLDQRRLVMGLEPFAEYEAVIRGRYNEQQPT